MTKRRSYLPTLTLVTAAAAGIAVLVAVTNTDNSERRTSTSPSTVTVTQTRPNNPAAAYKLYTVPVELPDGRVATCIANNAGALACEWPAPTFVEPIDLDTAPTQ